MVVEVGIAMSSSDTIIPMSASNSAYCVDIIVTHTKMLGNIMFLVLLYVAGFALAAASMVSARALNIIIPDNSKAGMAFPRI